MADTISVTCPECDKPMKVPASLAGKKVRCKGCEAVVAVPRPKQRETFQLAKEEEEPRQKKAPPPVDDENNPNPYAVTADDSHLVRCVFCAQVMDPPDARICANCGYDMLERRRHESKAVYQNTLGDYLSYHALTITAAIVILALIGLNIYCFQNFDEWFEGSIFEKDEKNPTTGKPEYWVGPGLAKTWIVIFSLGVASYAGRFIYRMCQKFHPLERKTKT